MNLSTLTTLTSYFSGDVNQTRYQQYTILINEAMNQFALDTKVLFKDQLYTIVAGTSNYALPADFMFEKKVTLMQSAIMAGGTQGGLKLDPINRADLEFYKRSSDWSQDTGTPRYYMIDPEVTRGNVLLYPQPQAADATNSNNLCLTYYPIPTALAASSDIPLNGYNYLAEYHIAIAYYAAWLQLASEPATEEMVSKRADLYKMYQNKVIEAIDRSGNTKSAPLRLKGGRIWR